MGSSLQLHVESEVEVQGALRGQTQEGGAPFIYFPVCILVLSSSPVGLKRLSFFRLRRIGQPLPALGLALLSEDVYPFLLCCLNQATTSGLSPLLSKTGGTSLFSLLP